MDTPASQERNRHVFAILSSIQNHDDSTALRSHIERCPPEIIQSWRDDGKKDLLHYAIINNNVVAAGTFFSLGLFKIPHEPVGYPYLHLACRLGYRSLVIMFLQERADDNKPALFDYPEVVNQNHHVSPNTKSSRQSVTDTSPGELEPKKLTPLDVAAEAHHLSCVKAVLDFCQARCKPTGKTKSESYTDLACKLDSPSALRLLLSEEPSQADLHRAVALSLKLAKPECLDTLLRCDIDRKAVFGGMNFFHVLFTYSYSFDKSWYESLVTVTSVLLRHGHPVHAFRPSRTFPLYSLLSHRYFEDLERSAPYRIACLLLMLNSGADPNFDEVKIEELVHENEYETAFGRKAYPSALHCLFDTISSYELDYCDCDTVSKFMFKCTEILLNHEADVNYVGKMGEDRYGTSLHAVADVSKHHGIDRRILLLLLRHGADPNIKTETLPVGYFCELLFRDSDNETSVKKLADCKLLTPLLKTMTLTSLNDAEKHVRLLLAQAGVDTCSKSCLGAVLSEIENYTKVVWTLRRLCMQKLWTQCGRNFKNLGCLPLPLTLKTEILADSM